MPQLLKLFDISLACVTQDRKKKPLKSTNELNPMFRLEELKSFITLFPITPIDSPALKTVLQDHTVRVKDALALLLRSFEPEFTTFQLEMEDDEKYSHNRWNWGEFEWDAMAYARHLAVVVAKDLKIKRMELIIECLHHVAGEDMSRHHECWDPEDGPESSTSYDGAAVFLETWARKADFPLKFTSAQCTEFMAKIEGGLKVEEASSTRSSKPERANSTLNDINRDQDDAD